MDNLYKGSINDELETFLQDIRLGQTPNDKNNTYFIRKITEEEMKLVEQEDHDYFESFMNPLYSYKNYSDYEFCFNHCERDTFTIGYKDDEIVVIQEPITNFWELLVQEVVQEVIADVDKENFEKSLLLTESQSNESICCNCCAIQ